MTLAELLDLANEWARMGWAVQAQMAEVLEGGDLSTKSPNALRQIAEFLRLADLAGIEGAQEIEKEITDFLAEVAS